MSKREAIARYILIIKKLRKHPASFAEILDYLDAESELQQYNYNISIRTFKRDIEDIETNFGIYITFDFSERKYKITDETFSETTDRILDAYDTFNALSISERISKYIHFDKRTPKGKEHLYHLLKAIEQGKTITFDYHKFWDKGAAEQRNVEPYALKEFKNRWYLLANDLKDGHIKTFALERMESLFIKRKKFVYPKEFNVQQHFEHCFGIVGSNGEEPEIVALSFEPHEANYLKSLPLHHSQEIVKDDEKEFIIHLKLCVTYDFLKELLSYGERVKVLQPQSLAQSIAENAKVMVGYYE